MDPNAAGGSGEGDDGGDTTTARTLCNRDCPDACGIVATVRDGRAVKLAGDPDHPVTRGFLCWRTNHFLQLQYGPDRVTTPLRRGPRAAKGATLAGEWRHSANLDGSHLREPKGRN